MKRNRPLFSFFLIEMLALCSIFYVIRGKWIEPTAISFWLKNIDVWPGCCGIASNAVDLVVKMKILLYDWSLFENEGWRACMSVWPSTATYKLWSRGVLYHDYHERVIVKTIPSHIWLAGWGEELILTWSCLIAELDQLKPF